jgi:hypothetical protein
MQERIDTKENQTRITDIERKIIDLGIDSKDPIAMGELVKQKDTEVKFLKKMLDLSKYQHVQTPKLQASYEEEEQLYHQLNESKRITTQLQNENERLREENEIIKSQ